MCIEVGTSIRPVRCPPPPPPPVNGVRLKRRSVGQARVEPLLRWAVGTQTGIISATKTWYIILDYLLTRAPLGYFYNAPHWGGGYFETSL